MLSFNKLHRLLYAYSVIVCRIKGYMRKEERRKKMGKKLDFSAFEAQLAWLAVNLLKLQIGSISRKSVSQCQKQKRI